MEIPVLTSPEALAFVPSLNSFLTSDFIDLFLISPEDGSATPLGSVGVNFDGLTVAPQPTNILGQTFPAGTVLY